MVTDANLLFRCLDNNSLKDLRIRNATTLATKKHFDFKTIQNV